MFKRGFKKTLGGFSAVSIFALLLSLSLPCIVYAYEKEVVLGEVYQTTKEKEILKDRLRLDLSFGWGYSFGQPMTGSFYDLNTKTQTYLRALNLDYSENMLTVRLTATYALTPNAGVYLAVPFGAVTFKTAEDPIARIFEEDKIKGGVGDLYGGIYYNLLSGSKSSPNIVLNVDVNSDTAKFSSLGDGLWNFTASLQARQFLSESFFVFGLGDYTTGLKKNGVKPGDVIGYGGGFGFMSGNGTARNDFGLRAAQHSKTTKNGATLLDKSDDLTFIWASKSLYKGLSTAFTIGNLNNGFSFKQNTFGFEISFPIF